MKKFLSLNRRNVSRSHPYALRRRSSIVTITNPVYISSSSSSNKNENLFKIYAAIILTASTTFALADSEVKMKTEELDGELIDLECGVSYTTGHQLINWSSTHSSTPYRTYEPKTPQEVTRVLAMFHNKPRTVEGNYPRIRPVGTALSPNGIGMPSSSAAISLSAIDHVVVDAMNQQVTVGAGATVSTVLAELKKHGLTLQNFSSIQEQQVGGWTQVAAHGTGCTLPTVEEMVVRMKLATPTEGIITLSESSNPELFRMAKVGLGSIGVVSELTMKCIPRMSLHEFTYSTSRDMIAVGHNRRLDTCRHVRYMWIPHTPNVVVVVSNPVDVVNEAEKDGGNHDLSRPTSTQLDLSSQPQVKPQMLELEHKLDTQNQLKIQNPTKPMYELLLKIKPEIINEMDVTKLSFSQLRDILLSISPLDLSHIQQVNLAEAEFWEASTGDRIDDSTNILGFDCGGEQWVYEVCFPIGTLEENSHKDIEYVQKLLKIIEEHNIPAPSPIEQRWTAASTSPMSPAYSTNPKEIFSWVGIIMYLPNNENSEERNEITKQFFNYCELLQPLMDEYKAYGHWAKVELPLKNDAKYNEKLMKLKNRISLKYPVHEFNSCRQALDPHNILGNELINELFGDHANIDIKASSNAKG